VQLRHDKLPIFRRDCISEFALKHLAVHDA